MTPNEPIVNPLNYFTGIGSYKSMMSQFLQSQRDRLIRHFGEADVREIIAILESMRLPKADELLFESRINRKGLSLLFLNSYGFNIRLAPENERNLPYHPLILQPWHVIDLERCAVKLYPNLKSFAYVASRKQRKYQKDVAWLCDELEDDELEDNDIGSENIGYLSVPTDQGFEGEMPLVIDHGAYHRSKNYTGHITAENYNPDLPRHLYQSFADAVGEAYNWQTQRFSWEPLKIFLRFCHAEVQKPLGIGCITSMETHFLDYDEPESIPRRADNYQNQYLRAHNTMVLES